MKYVEVLNSYNVGEIALIKSILDGEQIDYYFKGEHFNALGLQVQPTVLLVMEDQVEHVHSLLSEFSTSFL